MSLSLFIDATNMSIYYFSLLMYACACNRKVNFYWSMWMKIKVTTAMMLIKKHAYQWINYEIDNFILMNTCFTCCLYNLNMLMTHTQMEEFSLIQSTEGGSARELIWYKWVFEINVITRECVCVCAHIYICMYMYYLHHNCVFNMLNENCLCSLTL